MKKIIVLSIVVIITLLLISSAKVPEHKEDGYKIKVIKDTIDGKNIEEKIIFVSPDGEVVKELKKGLCPDQGEGTIISKNGEYALYSEITSYERTGEGGHPVGLVLYKINKYNIRGELIFEKEYETLFEDYANFNTKAMNEDGSKILFYYVDYNDDKNTIFNEYFPKNEGNRKYRFHLLILDTFGNEIFKKQVPPLGDRQISPDGKIVGGTTTKQIDGKWYKYLYFLNTETGEVKICKAEGEKDGELWMIGGSPLSNKTIGLFGYHPIKGRLNLLIFFDDLPRDPTAVLFQREGEE